MKRKLSASVAAIALLTASLGAGLAACSSDGSFSDFGVKVEGEYGKAPKVSAGEGTAPKDLKVGTVKKGTGDSCGADAVLKVNYHGQLWNGKKFDSSFDRGTPAIFSLKQVVPGWGQGLKDAKPGSRTLLVIPPELGYGDQATGDIPAGSTLVFVVDTLKCFSGTQMKKGEEQLAQAKATGKNLPGLEVNGKLGEKPVLKVNAGQLAKERILTVLAAGKGAPLKANDVVIVHQSWVDPEGKTVSTWDSKTPMPLQGEKTLAELGLDKELVGKNVGSRLALSSMENGQAVAFVMDIVGTL
ncbi:FKBP-type peptidyl-prolyl cis-trans isomerase [uncultured Varibaculum sp.]|uniref:FKBP-type peptidyl-prolyl cis-trans isomerase n=1 Tax=uncultured Varibaculum sp. TaxID=413896 RepID=UPI00258EB82C|nr:FKBP-type peptidyl-prolyl cis-trans isomerase [uncultured Varibaculum sp.]